MKLNKIICRVALLFCILLLNLSLVASQQDSYVTHVLPQNVDANWLIVGAGPEGIITVGVLMDIGIDPKTIVWVDPEFNVGRMGEFYCHVPSNNKAKEFIAFINACNTFQECSCPAIDALHLLDPMHACDLELIVEPLRCITQYLNTKVKPVQDSINALNFENGMWHVGTQNSGQITAQHVVLATGSKPRTLELNNQNVIPLDYALDQETLKTLVNKNDRVGVVGGAHSAILLLKYLSTMPVLHIYNFYRKPITYAIDQGCWALDPVALKGTTAIWAKEVLEKNPPANLSRIKIEDENKLNRWLRRCTKVIYAIGLERNQVPAINGTTPITSYQENTGLIAPRLFGIGVAFPEYKVDEGHGRHIIGLNCFMDYAHRLIPQWNEGLGDLQTSKRMQRSRSQMEVLSKLSDLFTICTL